MTFKKLTQFLSPIIFVLSLIVAFTLYSDISKTQKSLIEKNLVTPLRNGKKVLEKTVEPISENLEITHAQINYPESENNYYDESKVIERFAPILENIEELSSLGIANENGYEIDLILEKKGYIKCRKIFQLGDEKKVAWSEWRLDSLSWEKVLQKHDESTSVEPRLRPWFKGALNEDIYYSDPYVFNTNNELGLTISKSFYTSKSNSERWVLAFDVTLKNLSWLLSNQKTTPSSSLFILDNSYRVAGISELNEKQDNSRLLKSYKFYEDKPLRIGVEKWIQKGQSINDFSFNFKKDNYKGLITPISFMGNNIMYFGLVIPEKEALLDINRSKRNIGIGLLIIIILTSINVYSNEKIKKYYKLMRSKTHKIAQQSRAIEQKNDDIQRSMEYASKIQQSVMSNKNHLHSLFSESFVLFQPLEQVGGDFYWTTEVSGHKFLAVADCTGHGVPGSLVSMVGTRSFDQSVHEFGLLEPSKILDKSSELIKSTFSKYDSSLTDGMDASLMGLKREFNGKTTLSWAGANNPIWIVSNKQNGIVLPDDFESGKDRYFESEDMERYLIEFKPDRQPIGYFEHKRPFRLRKMQVKKGDIIYLFTDGIVDQFGGKNGKKLMVNVLRKKILEWSILPLKQQKKELIIYLKRWMGEYSQIDDIAFVAIRV